MKLFYRKSGSGPPLIILHGLFGSSDNWVTIAKNLSDTFTVYLPDLRNHGQSPHDNLHDYKSMSDDLFELVKDLKLTKFFLAGHSMGGKTAISFALKWPEMINGLLIADISPFTNENTNSNIFNQHFNILKTIESIDLSNISTRKEVELILEKKISSERDRGFILKNLQRNNSNTFSWKINSKAILNNLDKIMEGIERPSSASEQITGFPVIFIRGGDSEYIPVSHFGDIQNIFPAVEFITIKGAGHWIHSDKPEEVTKNIKRLLYS
jgi:esterase